MWYPASLNSFGTGVTPGGRWIFNLPRPERWCWAPMLVWYMPVISAERLIEQIGPVTNARSNFTPSAARRSTFGVRIVFSP